MKIFKFALLCCALWAMPALANAPIDVEDCFVFIDDFAVVPGEEYQMIIQLQNEEDGYSYNTQFDLTLPDGIIIKKAGSATRPRYFIYCTERTMPYAYGGLLYDGEYDDSQFKLGYNIQQTSSGAVRFVCANQDAKNEAIPGTTGPYLAVTIVVDASYDGNGIIKITNAQGSDITGNQAYHFPEKECRVLLASSVAEINDGEVGIGEAMTVAAKVPNQKSLILTDGNDNWLRVTADDKSFDAIKDFKVFKPGTLVGNISDASTNPLLTLDHAPVPYKIYDTSAFEDAEPDAFVIDECSLDHYDNFRPKPNQVIAISGYYFDGKLRGWSNNKGMSADLDLSWYEGENTFTEGGAYYVKPVVTTIKEAWNAPSGAPAKMAADDELYFQNYTLYPLEVPETATAVNELGIDKNVAGVKYVNVAGIESNEPFQGVNIMVTTYNDGTQKAVKVIK
ncbi:MAG: hypothetical protein II786_07175 [Muribaculaceae bacterium]|nr:hypothetical protein [Muribaculaceae bacterium]